MGTPRDFRLPSDGDSPWHEVFADRFVRWAERRHQCRSEGIPSPEAVDEATDYYAGLYVEKMPDPVAFARLIRRRGIPDWVNPYDIADRRYHELHSEGFLWADVQFLVGDLLSRSATPAIENVEVDAAVEVESVKRHHAQICWMMVLQETGGKWPHSLSQIHPDNLVAITLEALLNPHLVLWGLDPGLWKSPDLVA